MALEFLEREHIKLVSIGGCAKGLWGEPCPWVGVQRACGGERARKRKGNGECARAGAVLVDGEKGEYRGMRMGLAMSVQGRGQWTKENEERVCKAGQDRAMGN